MSDDATSASPGEEGSPPTPPRPDAFDENLERLGRFIRSQRKLADLTLREVSARANVSNPYLSAIERGLHTPSVRVLKAIGMALNVSAEALLSEAGVLEQEDQADEEAPTEPETESAIRRDPRLSDEQKHALLSVYRSYVESENPPG